jgi:hypothetical protein
MIQIKEADNASVGIFNVDLMRKVEVARRRVSGDSKERI